MSDFVTAAPARKALEINKRVNYTLGLVLGVDEFDQEQYYFLERGRQHNRALHGYGTICGLALSTDDAQVIVKAGLALNPQGKVISVGRDQCADLNAWLSVDANRQRLSEQITAGGGLPLDQAVLYVTLCYRECQSDKVPVPGAPCRSEEANMDFSRLTETFELKLETTPPAAEEEQMVRRFGHLLRRITVSGSGPFVSEAEMAQYVRDLLNPLMDSPLSSFPGSFPGSLPEDPLFVRPEELESILRAAFRVWVTEVRPQILASGKNCGEIPDEDCVLLGALHFGVTIDWKVTPDPLTLEPSIEIDESQRPYLLHTRLLQEWFISGSADGASGGGSAVPGDTVEEERAFGLGVDAGLALEYSRADHIHGTPDLPELVGDVTGAMGSNSVEKIRGVNVLKAPPKDGQILTFYNKSWRAAGDYVRTPANLPPYVIVAAGIVKGDNTSRPPVFNGLAAQATADGELTVTFSEPTPPANPQYIVKALPVFNQALQSTLGLKFPLVAVNNISPGQFTLFVTDLGDPISQSKLQQLEFAIEVSRFE